MKDTVLEGRLSTAREIAKRLHRSLPPNGYWAEYFSRYDPEKNAMHLAVMKAPYLDYVLEGKKTIESRFSMKKVAPYNRVHQDDVILLKEAGGPVVGVCQAGATWYYKLDPLSWRMIKLGFLNEIHADSEFWIENESAAYATLIRVQRPRHVEPMEFPKRDRRGWVVLEPGERQRLLESPLFITP